MKPEELKILEEKLRNAIISYQETDDFTEELSDLFLEFIEVVFDKRMPVFPSDEIREDCKIQAYLTCYDYAKKFDPDRISPVTGKKAKAYIYFSMIIRSSLAGSYVKEVNKRKYEILKP